MKITDRKQLVKLISYISMGDGGLYAQSKNSTAYFMMNMRKNNLDYVEYCKDILENIVGCSIIDRKLDTSDGFNRKPQVCLRSKSHPLLTTIRDRIYVGKYKGLDHHTLKLLDWESLAILYMSDGSFHEYLRPEKGMKKPSCRVTLNMKRLSYGDLFLLKKELKERLRLEWNIHKNNKFYYLTLRTKDVIAFMEGIASHVLPSFQYKVKEDFRTVDPSICEGDEIVRSMEQSIGLAEMSSHNNNLVAK